MNRQGLFDKIRRGNSATPAKAPAKSKEKTPSKPKAPAKPKGQKPPTAAAVITPPIAPLEPDNEQ